MQAILSSKMNTCKDPKSGQVIINIPNQLEICILCSPVHYSDWHFSASSNCSHFYKTSVYRDVGLLGSIYISKVFHQEVKLFFRYVSLSGEYKTFFYLYAFIFSLMNLQQGLINSLQMSNQQLFRLYFSLGFRYFIFVLPATYKSYLFSIFHLQNQII